MHAFLKLKKKIIKMPKLLVFPNTSELYSQNNISNFSRGAYGQSNPIGYSVSELLIFIKKKKKKLEFELLKSITSFSCFCCGEKYNKYNV